MNDSVNLNINNRTVQVWTNPVGDLGLLPALMRFTADNRTMTIYMWGFNEAYHSDVSIAMKLKDLLDSVDFLKGHATLSQDGKFVMVESDYLQSFVGKMVKGDRTFLTSLLNQNWGWIENYVQVTEWVHGYKRMVGL